MTTRYLILLALTLIGLTATAQTITFDTNDFKSISVYDTWAESPFRTKQLKGNAAIIPNHLNNINPATGTTPNPSAKIAGLQRSHYGSNAFGLRVDLLKPFRLTKEPRYVHVLVYKPVESRVLICGLGKRTEQAWQWQDGTCEQFMVATDHPVPANTWADVVLPISGFSYADPTKDGIDIQSLVICPDLRSMSADEKDFACYIDQIEINDNPEPRFIATTSTSNSEKIAVIPGKVRVTEGSLNGQMLTSDGKPLDNFYAPANKPLTVKIDPYPGFTHDGAIVRYGRNTSSNQSVVNGQLQYTVHRFTRKDFNSKSLLTIPASMMTGSEIHIEGQFIEAAKP